MSQLWQITAAQAQSQNQLSFELQQLQGEIAAVQGKQAILRYVLNAPSFKASKIKLVLPSLFTGKPSELNGWVFQIEQYCGMIGINKPTDMVKLAVSRLEGDTFAWLQQLAHCESYFELGMLLWSDFQSELVMRSSTQIEN